MNLACSPLIWTLIFPTASSSLLATTLNLIILFTKLTFLYTVYFFIVLMIALPILLVTAHIGTDYRLFEMKAVV